MSIVRPSSTVGCSRGRPDPSPPMVRLLVPPEAGYFRNLVENHVDAFMRHDLSDPAGGDFLLVLLFLPLTRILVRSQSEGHSGASPSGSGARYASRATRLAACPCDQEGSESRSRPVASDPVLAPYRRTRLLAASRQVRRCCPRKGSVQPRPAGGLRASSVRGAPRVLDHAPQYPMRLLMLPSSKPTMSNVDLARNHPRNDPSPHMDPFCSNFKGCCRAPGLCRSCPPCMTLSASAAIPTGSSSPPILKRVAVS